MQKPRRVMRTLSFTRKARYGIAVLSVALAAVVRLALEPVLGADAPLPIFAAAVIVASWCGGLGPGLLATALSVLIGAYLFLEPRYSIFNYSDHYNLIHIAFFALTGTIFSLLNTWLRNSIRAEQESAEAFRLLLEGVKDYAIFMLDPQGRVASWPPAAERVTGYTGDEIIGRDYLTLCTPEQIENGRPQRGLKIAAAEGRYEEEDWRIRKDGSRFWASVLTTALRDDRGQLRGFATVIRDITERKIVEDALRESQRFAQQIVEVSPSVIYIYDMQQRKNVFVNRSIAEALGYDTAQDAQGVEFIQLVMYPDDYQSFLSYLCRMASLRDDETSTFMRSDDPDWIHEYRFRRADGSYVYIQDRGRKLFDERRTPVLVAGAMVDITERKRAEETIRKSEEDARRQLAQLQAIYATAPVGLCFMDTECRFISINDRLAEIDGTSVEAHLGRTVRETVPEVADAIEPSLRHVIETGEPALNLEHSIVMSSQPGVVRHFITSYYPIKNNDGQVLGVNGVIVEITQRRKIEEELEWLLQQEKIARAEAEVANRMKDEFLATISHELRMPLTSILGWARIGASGSLSERKARHAMEVIAKSAQSQTRLVDDILDTSRIITCNLKLDTKPVEIERIFQATVDVIRPSAEVKGVALTAVIDVQGDVVFGDASRLQQAIWNLLSNAVKFTNEGGRIEARLRRAGNQIEITVNDTGIGIEPQFLPFVFERFRQADSTSTRKYGGLGLGLAIAHHIIELHGDSVSASSPGRNQGATFRIRLPLALTSRPPQLESEAPQIRGRKGSEECQRLDGVRILLVEDNPDTLDMLKFIFDECGAEVITTASASEALEALERFRPDMLISDIAMPNQDGFDLIRQVRSRGPEQGGKIPAVAVTAYASAEDCVRVLESGFQTHVSKPIDPGELIATVASLTGHIHF